MITFECTCGAVVRAADHLAGKVGKCPKCGALSKIPPPDAERTTGPREPGSSPSRPSVQPSPQSSGGKTVSHPDPNWVCENCGRVPGRIEKAFVFENSVVCAECHKRLRAAGGSLSAPASTQREPLATSPFDIGGLLSTRLTLLLVMLAFFAVGAAGMYWVFQYVSHEMSQQQSLPSKQRSTEGGFAAPPSLPPGTSGAKPILTRPPVSTPNRAAAVQVSENQKKAMTYLKRLDAKLDMGLDFRTYSSELADTWADVKPLAETPDPGANPRVWGCITAAMDYYKAAGDAWNNIIAPHDQDSDLEATESGYRLQWHKLLRKHKNELVRQYSWKMAHTTIEAAEAAMAGNGEQEAQKQDEIRKMQAELKRSLADIDQQYSKY